VEALFTEHESMRARKLSLDERCTLMRERQLTYAASYFDADVTAEKPLTVQQAAPLWGQSEKATRRYFAKVEGVRIIHTPYRYDSKRRRHVRKYDTILIPPSVLQREIRKITKSVA
jgi:hypothetical protein